MLDLNQLPSTYEEAVESLAAWHQDGNVTIYQMPDPDRKVVRLVEVSDETGDSEEVRPIRMGASVDFPFKTEVLLVSESDWLRISNGEKSLPSGWNFEDLVKTGEHDQG